jgi:spore maturation protein CgeB
VYTSVDELREGFTRHIRHADAVVLGSYVPDGIVVGDWIAAEARGTKAFYDIDTPVTLAALQNGTCDYLAPRQIAAFDLYLSFTGGPTLTRLEQEFGSPAARALYCSFDPELYYPEATAAVRWDLGYLGTYSDDRQPTLDRLLLAPAREWREGRFMVAGPQYPESITWPANVEREIHISPAHHRIFYTAQRFTLNVTRTAMVRAGWSPSVRLFEAAACGVPIISDEWPGLDDFFVPGDEIFVSRSAAETLALLQTLPEEARLAAAERARRRVASTHTAAHRAAELEGFLYQVRDAQRGVQDGPVRRAVRGISR